MGIEASPENEANDEENGQKKVSKSVEDTGISVMVYLGHGQCHRCCYAGLRCIACVL